MRNPVHLKDLILTSCQQPECIQRQFFSAYRIYFFGKVFCPMFDLCFETLKVLSKHISSNTFLFLVFGASARRFFLG